MVTCEDCRYFKTTVNDGKQIVTVCKALPPTPVVIPVQTAQGVGMGIQAIFPPINKGEWCGYHEPVPVKLVN